jgi:hypothetical protein
MSSKQSRVHLVSANLGRWLGAEIPERVVEAARTRLRNQDANRRLRGVWVRA